MPARRNHLQEAILLWPASADQDHARRWSNLFQSTNSSGDESPTSVSEKISDDAADDDICKVLEKIAGEAAAKRAVEGGKIEEEVEVIDLQLSEAERLALYATGMRYFTPDAWLSVGVNIQHLNEPASVILPIYTEAQERFWLFQTISKPARIIKSVPTTKIRGHWLDLTDDGSYALLHNDMIVGKNIIRTAHGPLYFVLNLNRDEPFHLPAAIRTVILATLQQQGLHSTT